ncbi:MAG: N-6 DNA methylase [Deltaproteobacteria bacterium]|nr:N-6 DNA methylase [Deltaproteobacteria bacterium]
MNHPEDLQSNTDAQGVTPGSIVRWPTLESTLHLWGIVTNGLTLRLLRNSTFVRRQAYVEFDLTALFEESRFQDFAALYRLLHCTRLPRGMAAASDCLLEQYYAHSVEQGGRVREHLRDGVEECITRLANGFLRHRANDELRCCTSPACTGNERISAEDLYRQLLRLVYRFLFLLVSEDRGLLSPDPIYREHYGIVRLRRLLENRAASTEHDDLWQSLRVLWKVLSDEKLGAFLKLAPLNGELFTPQDLDAFAVANRDLLEAFWHLAWYQENSKSPPRRVNYAALDVEELGSVYESLLEFPPHFTPPWHAPTFELVLARRERRSTGSHYTPPELVAPLIQHALEPVLEERIRAATTREQKEHAILSLKVCDIACGSGHFLLAAARRLGKELARVRTGEDEPAPERVREAVRDVISRCIYGVDKNPLAVELCRVALWLESHAEGKPLTFLDHRIRCGDSLVGIFDLEVLEHGIPDTAFKPVAGDDKTAAREARMRNASERAGADCHQYHRPGRYSQSRPGGNQAHQRHRHLRQAVCEMARQSQCRGEPCRDWQGPE